MDRSLNLLFAQRRELDPEATANILFVIIDGARALPIRNSAVDIKQNTEHLRIMLARFLRPSATRRPRAPEMASAGRLAP